MRNKRDKEVRAILLPYHEGSPVSRMYAAGDQGPLSHMYATGEITSDTVKAILKVYIQLDLAGEKEEMERLGDVMAYIDTVGVRPPVSGWGQNL